MSRPVAALSSQLLVRKGSARPIGLEPTEWTPHDVARAIRPSDADGQSAEGQSNVHQLPPAAPDQPVSRSRVTAARVGEVWSALASRWGLPTILFVAGIGMVTIVAATGPGSSPGSAAAPVAAGASYAAPASRPMGPTPVNWVDDGLMAQPGLAGR